MQPRKLFKLSTISAAVLIVMSVGALTAFAQNTPQNYLPLAPIPIISPATTPTGIPTANLLTKYVLAVFQFLIMITVFLSVVYIILGGVQYISTDSFNNKSEGRGKIEDALKGLLLAIVA